MYYILLIKRRMLRLSLSQSYMSKELRKLYKTALVSINYFFLKIVFKDRDCSKTGCGIYNVDSHTYESVKRELGALLYTINKEGLKDEVSDLFKKELSSNNYLDGKSKSEICYYFKRALYEMFGCEQPELFEFYVGLI